MIIIGLCQKVSVFSKRFWLCHHHFHSAWRFVALLWCTYLMGALKRYEFLKPIAFMGIAIGNIVFYVLDSLVPHPLLASDYLALLKLDVIE